MEAFINELSNYLYSPQINVFLVYVFGAMLIAQFQTEKNKLSLNEMTDDEIYFNVSRGFIDSEGRPTARYTYYQILAIPIIGLSNDVIVHLLGYMFGASPFKIYNFLWYGQFFGADTLHWTFL